LEQRGELLPHLLEGPGVRLPVVEEADGLPDAAEDALALSEAAAEVHPAQVLDQDLQAHRAAAAVRQQSVREMGELDEGRVGGVGALGERETGLRRVQ